MTQTPTDQGRETARVSPRDHPHTHTQLQTYAHTDTHRRQPHTNTHTNTHIHTLVVVVNVKHEVDVVVALWMPFQVDGELVREIAVNNDQAAMQNS